MMTQQTPASCESMATRIGDLLRELRLPYIRAYISDLMKAQDPALLNALSVMMDIFEVEAARRKQNRFKAELSKASLKYPEASLDATLYQPERKLDVEQLKALSSMDWLDEHRNVIVTGMTGAGKTHLACALAVCALHRGKTARYTRAGKLLNDLSASETAGTVNEVIDALAKCDLLIIDDFGLHALAANQCRNLFEIIEARDTCKSTLLVSQIPVKEMYDTFADVTYAEAILDRLLHKAYRLQMNGASMRKRD